MLSRVIYLLIFISFISCKKQEEEVPVSLDVVWKIDHPCSGLAANFEPVIYKSNIITAWSSYNPQDPTCGNAPIVSYNKNTGEELWRWTDHQKEGEDFTMWAFKYIYDDILVLVSERRVIYAINVNSGSTIWSAIPDETGANMVSGIEDNVFYFSVTANQKRARVNHINLYTGAITVLQEFNYDGTDFTASGHRSNPFYNNEGEIMLFTSHIKYDRIADTIANVNHLLNYTKNEIVHEVTSGAISSGNRTKFYKNNLYGIGGTGTEDSEYKIVKMNSESFEIEWEQFTGNGYFDLLCSEDYFYHTNGGDNPRTTKRSIETGEIIWEGAGGNFTSWIGLYENCLYVSNGSLAILNKNTGETELLLDSPNAEIIEGTFFSQGMSIDEETGRIYIGDYKSLFCYEPYGH